MEVAIKLLARAVVSEGSTGAAGTAAQLIHVAAGRRLQFLAMWSSL